jgi:hypothetical protein
MQPGAQLRGLIGYRTNVVRLIQVLHESETSTHLIEFGFRKGDDR